MIPELGHFSLWLALAVALVLSVVPMAGSIRGRDDLMALARPLTGALLALVALGFACLTSAFVANDFSVLYVANHSNSGLPLMYRVAGVWGGHEGSLLLWAMMLAGWMGAVAGFSRHLTLPMVARILAVMGMVTVGFLLFTLLTSNPFERVFPAPADGRDLNPLLQDPGMIIHPPMLYMGYVGFSVAFAFAIAALIGGRLDATWARWSRPWTTLAWSFLTIGIMIGSWWAYYELGWGGWWFWDPVENASFMPWLVGTALLHSLAVTEKRGAFKSWTVLLAIVAFSLSLLGTFLVRSGVLSSVHAFATDPSRGLFILGFLVVVVGCSLALYAWRAPNIGLGSRFSLLSRETMLLTNNVMLAAAMAAVLLGTLYPLVLDALGVGKISVGPPYFDTVFVPLMAPIVFLMGVGPLARWKQTSLPDLAQRLRWALVVAIVAGVLGAWVAGRVSAMTVLGLSLAYWVFAATAVDLWGRVRPLPDMGFGERLRRLPRSTIGMMTAHAAIGVFIVGVTMVNSFQVERDVRMAPGDSTTIGDYVFTFKSIRDVPGPNYEAVQGWIEVTKNGDKVTDMLPEKRIYRVQRNPMTEAAIDTGLTRDLYVSLGEPVDNGAAWIVRIYYKPYVDWIWGGCALMAIGALVAATDRRYRRRSTDSEDVPVGVDVSAGAVGGAVPQPARKVAATS